MPTRELSTLHLALLDMLSGVAEAGDRCPSNADLGARFGKSAGWAEAAIRLLVKHGLIVPYSNRSCRAVMIVSTGKRTAPTRGPVDADLPVSEYVSRVTETAPTRIDPTDPATLPSGAVVVDRDPCPFCGVRGDVGCVHSRRWAA